MKKFLATLLIGAVAATSIFGFTACGGDNLDNSDESENKVVTIVVEDEWKVAIAAITDGKVIAANCAGESVDSEGITLVEADMENNALHLDNKYKDSDGNEMIDTYYVWKSSDGKYYMASNGDKLIYKEEIEKMDYEEFVKMNIWHYAGVNLLCGVKASENFSGFTYNEESKAYVATLPVDAQITDFNDDAKLNIYFENGKIVKMEATLIKNENHYIFDYEYGKTVTVPSDFLSAEVAPAEQ